MDTAREDTVRRVPGAAPFGFKGFDCGEGFALSISQIQDFSFAILISSFHSHNTEKGANYVGKA